MNEYGDDKCPKCGVGLHSRKTKILGAVFECGSSLKDGVFEQYYPCLIEQLQKENADLRKENTELSRKLLNENKSR